MYFFFSVQPNIVRIGEENLLSGLNNSTFDIVDIFVHPDYRDHSYYNDIALVKLRDSVPISPKLRPTCLWQYNNFNFDRATSIGYGAHSYGSN